MNNRILYTAVFAFTAIITVQVFSDKIPFLENNSQAYASSNVTHKKFGTADELADFFKDQNYKLDEVRKSKVVPRLFVEQIPGGMRKMEVHKKTSLFIRMLLPNIIRANETIMKDRQALIDISNKVANGGKPSDKETSLVKKLEKIYKSEPGNLKSLLTRVDTIPVSLAITQAIDESGWGTSRFAIQGNSLFGEHLPANSTHKSIQAKGAKVKMAAFDTVLEAAEEYMHNLNTSRAYRHLREMRADMRKKHSGQSVDGKELANALKFYSERGMKYVKDIHNIMRHYHLHDLDAAQLDQKADTILIRFR